MSSPRHLGAKAEDRAASYLLSLGYTVVTRRFKSSREELDIIAFDGETLVVVEVKAGMSSSFVPEEQVSSKKAARIVQAVDEYLHKTGATEPPVRYDIIAITPDEIRHHIDAFRPNPFT